MAEFQYFFIIVAILFTVPYISINPVSAAPSVQISPACGPAVPGFNIIINANGFKPNSNVNWKLVNSQNQVPLYGYFQSNDNGGFNDVTFVNDLPSDTYKMYFGTDDNNDNEFDSGYATTYVEVTIPCTTVQQQQPLSKAPPTTGPKINWLQLCSNPIVDKFIDEPCETLTTPDGYTLTQEGKRVVGCFLGAGLLLAVDPSGKALAEAQTLASTAGLCGGIPTQSIQPPIQPQPIQPPIQPQPIQPPIQPQEINMTNATMSGNMTVFDNPTQILENDTNIGDPSNTLLEEQTPPLSVQAAETYKVWVLAYNVDPKAGFVSACAFGPSVDTPNCSYFDLSKIFTEKGDKKDFIAGFVPIVSNIPSPADMQVCLEAQLLNGTNASPGDWVQCKPVIKDNNGFYISKIDFTGLDHTKLSPYHPTTSTSSDNNLELTVPK